MTLQPIRSGTGIKVEPPQKASTNKTDVEKSVVVNDQTTSINGTTTPVTKVERTSQGSEHGGQWNSDIQHTNEQIRKAVDQINRSMAHGAAVFGIHEETNRVTIKIIDKESGELIRELPPEKTLDMISKVWELAGLLVDEKR
jgi:flagellar protein FlaG